MSKRQYHIFYLMMQADGIYEKSVEIHLLCALAGVPEEEPAPEEAKGMEGFGAAKGTGKA